MDLLAQLSNSLGTTLTQSGLVVVAKSKFGPEFVVYDTSGTSQPSIFSDMLGPVGIQVRDPTGKVLYSAGTWPDTSPLAIAAVVGGVAGLVFLLARGLKWT